MLPMRLTNSGRWEFEWRLARDVDRCTHTRRVGPSRRGRNRPGNCRLARRGKTLRVASYLPARRPASVNSSTLFYGLFDGRVGLEVLGSSICQMHLKSGRKLMEERHLMEPHPQHPEGRAMSIDWTKAFPIIKASGFDRWFAFETPHASPEACVEETKRNIAFVVGSICRDLRRLSFGP